MKTINIGDTILVKRFGFLGKEGGTGESDSDWNERFSNSTARFTVTKVWDDYECGIRGWCEPDESDTDLMMYLERNAYMGTPKDDVFTTGNIKFPEGKYTCFFSEFDVIETYHYHETTGRDVMFRDETLIPY